MISTLSLCKCDLGMYTVLSYNFSSISLEDLLLIRYLWFARHGLIRSKWRPRISLLESNISFSILIMISIHARSSTDISSGDMLNAILQRKKRKHPSFPSWPLPFALCSMSKEIKHWNEQKWFAVPFQCGIDQCFRISTHLMSHFFKEHCEGQHFEKGREFGELERKKTLWARWKLDSFVWKIPLTEKSSNKLYWNARIQRTNSIYRQLGISNRKRSSELII